MKSFYPIFSLFLCTGSLLSQTTGSLTEERWNGVQGAAVVDLQHAIAGRSADITLLRAAAEVPENTGSSYGRRLRGTITAPVTGAYAFFIAGDDHVSLFLSSDASGLNKKQIAFHTNYSGSHEWFKYGTQRSAAVYLKAGQQYFIEALQKESGGADSLSIGWAYTSEMFQPHNIGAVSTAVWTANEGTYSVSVGGGNLSGSSDNCAFTGRTITGDFDAIARISSVKNAGAGAQFGLMARGSTAANAMTVAVLQSTDRTVQVESRITDNGSYFVGSPSAHAVDWIKLSRRGNVFHAYESGDGIHWNYRDKYTRSSFPAETVLGLVAANSGGLQDLEVTFSDVQVLATSAAEVIPAEHLSSFVADTNDADDNGLDDAWEAQHPLTGSAFDQSAFGDPDGDLITNLEEFQSNSDPNVANGAVGNWMLEKWTGLALYDVNELRGKDAYYQSAQSKTLHAGNRLVGINQGVALRMRGYITAPESGVYYFWLSSSNAAELWLSSDNTKFRKQRIAVMGADAGTGHGIRDYDSNLFDQFASQMSEGIYLEAGEKYFIEALSAQYHIANRHVSIAWAAPNEDRKFLPLEVLESYSDVADDSDDDYLPDSWETQYGLSITDNGLVDRARQGENGDFDSDGLINRLEFVYGSDPSNADTDGDGISDWDEINSYGTDPTLSDAPSENLVRAVDLSTFTNADAPWAQTSSGLVSGSFRGGLEWGFTVPSNGNWILHLNTKLLGTLYFHETVPASIFIDGTKVWSGDIVYGRQRNALTRLITPYLTAGQHTVRLFIDNMVARRTVSIQSLKLYQPDGLDADGDGVADWVTTQLLGANSLFGYKTVSRTSPAFLEGRARIFEETHLNGNPVLKSADSHGWYSDLALNAVGETDFIVSFESNLQQTGKITWGNTNVLENETLVIRKGDSLKLSATPAVTGEFQGATITFTQNPAQAAQGTVVLNLADDNATAQYQFNTAGNYAIEAAHANGETGTLNVVVKQAEFSTVAQDVLSSHVVTMSLPLNEVNAGLVLEAGDRGTIRQLTDAGNFQRFQLSSSTLGEARLAARLHKGGPILGTKLLNFVGVSDALQNDLTGSSYSQDFPGYYQLTSPMVVTNLPAGAKIKVTIFRAGVTFPDGTKVMWLEADDLVNGITTLKFLFPIGMSGGYCHYLDIYDRNGAFLGRR